MIVIFVVVARAATLNFSEAIVFWSWQVAQASQAAEKVPLFVILSEAKNPSWINTKD
jgi:hypothetical protein